MSAFLVCFNRFHNYIVQQLAAINERGRFSVPVEAVIEALVRQMNPKATKEKIAAETKKQFDAAVAKRDNDLFQTGRLYVLS